MLNYNITKQFPYVLSIILFGVIGLLLTPREENPQIIVPAAEVVIPIAGFSPLEVERLVLTPIENSLNAMQGVKHIYGYADQDLAKIQVEFEVGEDLYWHSIWTEKFRFSFGLRF